MNARRFNICGWLSVACCLPYIVPLLGDAGLANLMDSDLWLILVLGSIFLSPIAGVILASIASIKARWWLLLAGVWIAVFVFLCWDLYKHPIVIQWQWHRRSDSRRRKKLPICAPGSRWSRLTVRCEQHQRYTDAKTSASSPTHSLTNEIKASCRRVAFRT